MSSLYIIGSLPNGPIKVGVSSNVKNRLSALQHGFHLPLKIIKSWKFINQNASRIETVAHYELAEYRLRGEWFSCSPQEAIQSISGILARTQRGKDLSFYNSDERLVKSIAAQRAGLAYGKKAKARIKMATDRIRERWGMPSNVWPTKILLEEVDISLNSAKSILGNRPIAQANYRAKEKRKEHSAKGVRYKRAGNYIDEAPDYAKG